MLFFNDGGAGCAAIGAWGVVCFTVGYSAPAGPGWSVQV
jgi:hypothetical protein